MINKFDGQYAFLSNFYNSTIFDKNNNLSYPTVEHAFQAAKAQTPEEAYNISIASTPGMAKRLGRHCKLRPNWEEIKNDVMLNLLRQKFADPILQKKLIDTMDEYLEEGNTWHDNYWGVCYCVNCEDTIGKNHLGKALMQVRSELRNG